MAPYSSGLRWPVLTWKTRLPPSSFGGGGQDGVDDTVDRDQVHQALHAPGEVRDLAPGVAEDDRLGHLEAVEPARLGLAPGALDDGRPHDRQLEVAGLGQHRPLGQRLGEVVDVVPAQRPGPRDAVGDQLLLDPVEAAAFGVAGDLGPPAGRRAFGAWAGSNRRRSGSRTHQLDAVAGGVEVGQLLAPVELRPLGQLAGEQLRHQAAAGAADVGRRDVHESGLRARLPHQPDGLRALIDVGVRRRGAGGRRRRRWRRSDILHVNAGALRAAASKRDTARRTGRPPAPRSYSFGQNLAEAFLPNHSCIPQRKWRQARATITLAATASRGCRGQPDLRTTSGGARGASAAP